MLQEGFLNGGEGLLWCLGRSALCLLPPMGRRLSECQDGCVCARIGWSVALAAGHVGKEVCVWVDPGSESAKAPPRAMSWLTPLFWEREGCLAGVGEPHPVLPQQLFPRRLAIGLLLGASLEGEILENGDGGGRNPGESPGKRAEVATGWVSFHGCQRPSLAIGTAGGAV